jgi:hypothetical protein
MMAGGLLCESHESNQYTHSLLNINFNIIRLSTSRTLARFSSSLKLNFCVNFPCRLACYVEYVKDSQISQKMKSHLDDRKVTKRNFHTEDPKIFGATEKKIQSPGQCGA